MVNVLLSSAGRRVELLRGFQEAYRALGIQGRVVAIDVDPLAPALQVADRYYLVPRMNSPEYLPALLEICRREEISAVFPLIDPDIPFLARHRAKIEQTGAKLAVIPTPAVDTINDKWRTTQFFRELGLRTPRSWLPQDCDPARMEYPVFIKPRNGSAAKHAFRVESERELRFFVDYVPDPIIQEHLDGPEITNDVACGFGGEVLGIVSRKRLEVRTGEVSKGVTVSDPAILEACARIARALPAIGPITVQCMMHRGEPYFTEINARFGGGVPLGIAAGVDAPLLLLAELAGMRVEHPVLGQFETGLFMTRFDDSFLITETEREQMARHRI
jgi:carbamoyl-phosphate synthase large subunit